ncbi:hypothetical protein ABZ801_31755 [Actinomadura sp. NPDC047616]|uniref:hypothetical protein n=1 Tax=Actinomadura sp. NPDC047616 TaxID=3155914 RepID=UPI003410FE74
MDDVPGSAGSPTEASSPASEENPAERAEGVGASLPADDMERPAEHRDRHEDDEDTAPGRGGRGSDEGGFDGGDLAFEFRPEPVKQRPTSGQHGPMEGPSVPPDERQVRPPDES